MLPEAKPAGLRLVFWPIERLYRIPLRVVTLDVPPQDIITRDNVSVKMNAVCYSPVVDANTALSQVKDYLYAASQKAQTTLRSVVGQFELTRSFPHIPETMQRAIAKQAEAERERRAKIIHVEGEF
jgi:regulator of protease activity HflC (stomatin/prohibitin superfamily)